MYWSSLRIGDPEQGWQVTVAKTLEENPTIFYFDYELKRDSGTDIKEEKAYPSNGYNSGGNSSGATESERFYGLYDYSWVYVYPPNDQYS